MKDVIIYTQNECPPCSFIKQYLSSKQIHFEERNISNQQFRNEMIDFNAFSTPFILLKGKPMYNVDLDQINQELSIIN